MAISDHTIGSLCDKAAIADLRRSFYMQQQAFASDRNPSLHERRARIAKLVKMLLDHRDQISAALSQDFGCHPAPAADLIEVLGPVARAQYASDRLEEWMRPDQRAVDPALMGSAKAYIKCQPKGVIGNIVPWNFPLDLSVGPLVEMLAAGNRVIIKPSDYTPACATVLRSMISATFPPDLVYAAVGGLDLARAFVTLPWDHLLYTGSARIGKQVMQAAAQNLTPVTLELGGKCPALLTPGSVNARNIQSIVGTKSIKNGQMCISVDHCLVARDEIDSFVHLAIEFMREACPEYSKSVDCTGIISPVHFDRVQALLDEARSSGCRIVDLESTPTANRDERRMPLYLIIDPPADLRLMQEEIFGPLLPLIPYDDLDAAVATINSGDRPLGVYIFGEEHAATALLDKISCGGAAINACAIQGALPSLGFGGSGASGMGRHHGIEGFREFSNPRGVVVRGNGDQFDAFYAPYGKAAALVKATLGGN